MVDMFKGSPMLGEMNNGTTVPGTKPGIVEATMTQQQVWDKRCSQNLNVVFKMKATAWDGNVHAQTLKDAEES